MRFKRSGAGTAREGWKGVEGVGSRDGSAFVPISREIVASFSLVTFSRRLPPQSRADEFEETNSRWSHNPPFAPSNEWLE